MMNTKWSNEKTEKLQRKKKIVDQRPEVRQDLDQGLGPGRVVEEVTRDDTDVLTVVAHVVDNVDLGPDHQTIDVEDIHARPLGEAALPRLTTDAWTRVLAGFLAFSVSTFRPKRETLEECSRNTVA